MFFKKKHTLFYYFLKHGTALPKCQEDTLNSLYFLLVRGSQGGPGEHVRPESLYTISSASGHCVCGLKAKPALNFTPLGCTIYIFVNC